MAERTNRNARRHAHSGLASYRPNALALGPVDHQDGKGQERQIGTAEVRGLPVTGSVTITRIEGSGTAKNRWTGKA